MNSLLSEYLIYKTSFGEWLWDAFGVSFILTFFICGLIFVFIGSIVDFARGWVKFSKIASTIFFIGVFIFCLASSHYSTAPINENLGYGVERSDLDIVSKKGNYDLVVKETEIKSVSLGDSRFEKCFSEFEFYKVKTNDGEVICAFPEEEKDNFKDSDFYGRVLRSFKLNVDRELLSALNGYTEISYGYLDKYFNNVYFVTHIDEVKMDTSSIRCKELADMYDDIPPTEKIVTSEPEPKQTEVDPNQNININITNTINSKELEGKENE